MNDQSKVREAAIEFERNLPFQHTPYNKRNWGHPLHSLCSYQGKMKPALAHFLIANFTKPGDVVLDPLAGVGTIPFEACLQGRIGIANDINIVAYANCLAKVKDTTLKQVQNVISNLAGYIGRELPTVEDVNAIRLEINGPIQAYYEITTLREIAAARQYFSQHPIDTPAEAIVFASLLHILHGNRPYALSRRSHSITPFSPTGPFEYRPLVPRLTKKAVRSMTSDRPSTFCEGGAVLGPFEALAKANLQVDAIITSPPFFGSTRFYLANWLRLWFAGWEQEDFSGQRMEFLETRQAKSMDVYKSFFEVCEATLRPGGLLIVHLGRSKRCDMAHELSVRITPGLTLVHRFEEDVSEVEKHGVSDKGITNTHQFLFILRR